MRIPGSGFLDSLRPHDIELPTVERLRSDRSKIGRDGRWLGGSSLDLDRGTNKGHARYTLGAYTLICQEVDRMSLS